MVINFFNNIYAAAYRSYDKYEEGSRYKAASFIFICILGLFAMIIGIIRNILNFNFIKNQVEFTTSLILLGFFFIVILWKYYSKEKVEMIINVFEKKTIFERKLWGFIAIISFIIPWIAFALLLSNPQN